MRRWTNRQLQAALAWLAAQADEPSLTDYYLMQVCAQIAATPHRIWGKRPPRLRLDEFRLGNRPKVGKALTAEEAAALSKAAWLGRLGLPASAVKPPPEGNGKSEG